MTDLLELEKKLIGFDTTSVKSNMELVDFLVETLKSQQAEVEVMTSPEGGKANVLATFGPRDMSGLMLAGHMDTVPVEGQKWNYDPFALTAAEGRFYGRGTADMKCFIGQCIVAMDAFAHKKLNLPVHLAFTYDEEINCNGADHLIEHLQQHNRVMPKCAVIGEPTNFEVFRVHKGIAAARVRVSGVEGHSSKPVKGANAIYPAAKVIEKLMEVEAELRQKTSQTDLFEVPYTTLSVGMVQGGTAFNIIPNQCEVSFEYRTMPGEDDSYVMNQVQGYIQEILLPEFQKLQPGVDISMETVMRRQPLNTPVGTEIETIALELAGKASSGSAPYYTEGAIYSDAGIPTVICGPGDIDQAHRPNEFITQEQMEKGPTLLAKLVERVCLG